MSPSAGTANSSSVPDENLKGSFLIRTITYRDFGHREAEYKQHKEVMKGSLAIMTM